MISKDEEKPYLTAFRSMVGVRLRNHCTTTQEHADWFFHWQRGWFAHAEGKPYSVVEASGRVSSVLEPTNDAWTRGWLARKSWFESTLELEPEAAEYIPADPNPDGTEHEGTKQ